MAQTEQAAPASAAPAPQDVARKRPAYLSELARGTDRFHEPRRADCPWCGSHRLGVRLRTTDLIQHKPGTFTVDRCADCDHSFQNPRLTPEGLDFYYRDFYDGLGGKEAEKLFGAESSTKRYLSSTRAMRTHMEPQSWLDVGTGHGHFPSVAKTLLRHTNFDGLDLSDGVEEAVTEGRIREGHRGFFPELAASLAGRYDAVSMFHYLEHSRDPRAELEAAKTVLRPGGHLMIEVPDPESRYAKLLGKWWCSYFQPQHLHFVPLANLRKELEKSGFTVVGVERREPHIPFDLTTAVALWLNCRFPKADLPWRAKAATASQLKVRKVAWWAALPLLAVTYGLDMVLPPLITRMGFSNAYRVIARKNRRQAPTGT
ncbi:class I SAM-dependent methyltransferase [Streptomyces sp. NBC_01304]|uniref:class I SAM-dependent methyltransferase n=1 Tax=Streptomyces sp. NBC_01304 TaxID=2903818 RepID=UPI002E0E490D|nr:class I SAM-dependent methyltransferase [Streptomyces sp. NBC_01304]